MDTRTGFLISQIKSVSGRLFERILQDCGVEEFNGAQGRILYVLWQADRVPIVELSQKTGLAKNTLTSMLGRMEESGLILREQSEEDRRQTIISLTDKGAGGKVRRGLRAGKSVIFQGVHAGGDRGAGVSALQGAG